MLEHYQRHMLKLANIMPNWKTILSIIQNDLLHEFSNKAYRKATGLKHLTFIIETFELIIKSCKKFDLLFATAGSLETVKSLNCSICWTVSVILTKFAAHAVWIIINNIWKFGSNLYYNDWNTEFFLRYCF